MAICARLATGTGDLLRDRLRFDLCGREICRGRNLDTNLNLLSSLVNNHCFIHIAAPRLD
jgi:hypothetical protein